MLIASTWGCQSPDEACAELSCGRGCSLGIRPVHMDWHGFHIDRKRFQTDLNRLEMKLQIGWERIWKDMSCLNLHPAHYSGAEGSWVSASQLQVVFGDDAKTLPGQRREVPEYHPKAILALDGGYQDSMKVYDWLVVEPPTPLKK